MYPLQHILGNSKNLTWLRIKDIQKKTIALHFTKHHLKEGNKVYIIQMIYITMQVYHFRKFNNNKARETTI